MYLQNLHTHSHFCDGKNTLEEMCERAVELGFDSIGFSRHACMPHKSIFCKGGEAIVEYKKKACELKEAYEGKLDIFCGAEFDLYSVDPQEGYDYIIGSFHYLKENGELVGIDRSPEEVQKVVDNYFGGNGLAFARHFYEQSVGLCDISPDIIGHFDLVTKHAKTLGLFDEDSKEYQALAVEAIREISKKVRVFEINTGCVSRGYRETPYLAPFIVKELKSLDCQITISSDCHNKDFFDCEWDAAKTRLLECGYKNIVILTKDGFKEEAII